MTGARWSGFSDQKGRPATAPIRDEKVTQSAESGRETRQELKEECGWNREKNMWTGESVRHVKRAGESFYID